MVADSGSYFTHTCDGLSASQTYCVHVYGANSYGSQSTSEESRLFVTTTSSLDLTYLKSGVSFSLRFSDSSSGGGIVGGMTASSRDDYISWPVHKWWYWKRLTDVVDTSYSEVRMNDTNSSAIDFWGTLLSFDSSTKAFKSQHRFWILQPSLSGPSRFVDTSCLPIQLICLF